MYRFAAGMLFFFLSTRAFSLDSNLELCIKSKVDTSQVKISELSELSCSSKGIKSIEGIEALSSLMVLDLTDNLITDFTPLKQLKGKSLAVAYLGENKLPCEKLEETIALLDGLATMGLDRKNCVAKGGEPKPKPKRNTKT